ncbi:MAG: hypothetical protein ACLSHO_00795 [Dysosmobacter sp.]
MYEQYLIRLLAPLGLYDLRAPHNGGELAALGGELDSVSEAGRTGGTGKPAGHGGERGP